MAEECEGHLFPKLRLKIRPNLVQLSGGTRDLPITDPQVKSPAGILHDRKPCNHASLQASLAS